MAIAGAPSPSLAVTQCNDTLDNDTDGRIDLADAGCLADPKRDDESGEVVVNSTLDKIDADTGDGVCETDVAGECTLRAAVMQTNATPGEEGVQVPAGTFELTILGSGAAAGDLDIVDDLAIVGAGAENTRIGSDNTAFRDRPFEIAAGNQVIILGVTIHQAWTGRPSSFFGGGFFNSGTLLLINTTVSGNGASYGGGIYNEATLTLIDSTVSGNTVLAYGGGIFNSDSGTLTLTNSTVSGNTGFYLDEAYAGGGILNFGAAALVDSTISDNRATYGAGMYNGGVGSTMTSTNVTVSGNAAFRGGGIHNGYGGIVTLTNSTVTENTAGRPGGGIRNTSHPWYDSIVQSTNSIVGGNDDENCNGPFTSLGYNLSDDTTCFSASGTDLVADAQLGPLADNGGPTLTHLPLTGSPAIDAGDNGACPATDQRGAIRPLDGDDPPDGYADCDIGAVEVLPEPGGLLMLALGIAFLGTVGRRRWRA